MMMRSVKYYMDTKEDFTEDKLYNWIMSCINVHNVEYRENYIPIWELVREINRNGKTDSNIKSTLNIGEDKYLFEINLKKV